MSDTTFLFIAFGLMTLGFLGIGYQMNRYSRKPLTLSDEYCAKVDQALEEQEIRRRQEQQWRQWSLHANGLWDAALDEERRQMEADFAAAEQEYLEGEFVRAIEAWLEQRERTA